MNDKEVRDVILSLGNDSFHETGQQTSSQKESDCTCRSESEAEPSCSGWQQRSPSLSSASTPNPSITTKLPGSWTESMNVVLCREVEYVNPFKFKERTKERGKAWEEAASNLKKHGYEITKRSVRDRYKNLKETVTKRNGKELKESGISPYLTDWQLEVTQIVEDLVEVEKETKEQQNDEVKKQLPVDGVEMRKRALESFTETNKRIKSEIDGPPRKRRNTGDDATNFLMRKLELDTEFKEREFQLKREEAIQRRQDEARRRDREEREEERRRSDEERRREKEDRDEERRRKEEERRREREEREEERRRDREEREEERRRKEEANRERRMELLQEQLLQQNQMIMMMLKKQQNE